MDRNAALELLAWGEAGVRAPAIPVHKQQYLLKSLEQILQIAEKDRTIRSLRGSYWGAKDFADRAKEENQQLRSDLKDYGILRKFLGPAKTDELIQQAKAAEVVKRQRRSYDRWR